MFSCTVPAATGCCLWRRLRCLLESFRGGTYGPQHTYEVVHLHSWQPKRLATGIAIATARSAFDREGLEQGAATAATAHWRELVVSVSGVVFRFERTDQRRWARRNALSLSLRIFSSSPDILGLLALFYPSNPPPASRYLQLPFLYFSPFSFSLRLYPCGVLVFWGPAGVAFATGSPLGTPGRYRLRRQAEVGRIHERRDFLRCRRVSIPSYVWCM